MAKSALGNLSALLPERETNAGGTVN